jgi:xylan 1,4-beta-xylosidase
MEEKKRSDGKRFPRERQHAIRKGERPLTKYIKKDIFFASSMAVFYIYRFSNEIMHRESAMGKLKGARVFPVAALIGMAGVLFSVQAASYTIAVNAATKTGSWNRFYERGVACDHMYTVLSTAYGRGIKNAMKIARDSAGFQYVRGHGVLDDDVAVYRGVGNYSWTNFDRIFDSIVAVGMKPIVEISFMPGALATARTCVTNVWYNGVCGYSCAPSNWPEWVAFIRAIIAHCETRYGAAEVRNNWYFELWNEPNWMYACGGQDNGYLRLYDSTAVAVSAQDPLVRLGGPAENGGSSPGFIPTFIQHCRTYNKKLDFVTYHRYSNDYDGTGNHDNDAPSMNTFHRQIVDLCRNNNFTGPILCTEWGSSYTQGRAVHDNEMAASFVAKTVHLLNSNDTLTYPPPYAYGWWALSDLYEETNNTGSSPAFCGCYGLLCRGVTSIAQSYDVRKPAFNAYMLLHRLNTYKVSCTGGTTGSPGVNAVATISATNDTVSVLIYSHVDNTSGNNTTTDAVTLNITGIPTTVGITTATMKHWVIDATHSNSYRTWVSAGSPANPSAAQWTTIANAAQLAYYDTPGTVTLGGTTGAAMYSKSITQYYYSVGLVQLTNFRTTGVSGPSEKFKDLASGINARVAGKNLVLDMPFAEQHAVRLYSANGRKIIEWQITGAGTHLVPLAGIPSGVYMLECAGGSLRTVSSVIAGR